MSPIFLAGTRSTIQASTQARTQARTSFGFIIFIIFIFATTHKMKANRKQIQVELTASKL